MMTDILLEVFLQKHPNRQLAHDRELRKRLEVIIDKMLVSLSDVYLNSTPQEISKSESDSLPPTSWRLSRYRRYICSYLCYSWDEKLEGIVLKYIPVLWKLLAKEPQGLVSGIYRSICVFRFHIMMITASSLGHLLSAQHARFLEGNGNRPYESKDHY